MVAKGCLRIFRRDVADAHIRALFAAEAAGHRHIVSSTRWIAYAEWAAILRDEGYTIAAEVDDDGSQCQTPATRLDDSRVRNVLGIELRDLRATVLDMAKSVVELNVF